MKSLSVLILFVTILFLSCDSGNKDTSAPKNLVLLQPYVTYELVSTATGPKKYWSPVVNVSRSMTDTSYAVVRWEQLNASNVSQGVLQDTVVIAPGNSGTIGKISSYLYTDNWTSKNVVILNAWCRTNGLYQFTY